jgi:hypothetical protein
LLSAWFAVIAVSVGVAGADSVTSLLSVLEQPARVNANAVLSASDNMFLMIKTSFFFAERATANFNLITFLMPYLAGVFDRPEGDEFF